MGDQQLPTGMLDAPEQEKGRLIENSLESRRKSGWWSNGSKCENHPVPQRGPPRGRATDGMSKRFLGSWEVTGGVVDGSWSGKELGSTDRKLALIMEGRKRGGRRGLSMVIQKGSQMETRAASSKVGEGPGWDRCQGGGL